MTETPVTTEVERLAQELAEVCLGSQAVVATAESLTGGQLAAAITAAPEASKWYRGGVVAYQPSAKHTLLRSPDGPVVTAPTAIAMTCSVADLLDADYAVGVTGVGGPDAEEGEQPGTVYLASCDRGQHPIVERHEFAGSTVEVLEQTIEVALSTLIARVRDRGD